MTMNKRKTLPETLEGLIGIGHHDMFFFFFLIFQLQVTLNSIFHSFQVPSTVVGQPCTLWSGPPNI